LDLDKEKKCPRSEASEYAAKLRDEVKKLEEAELGL